MAGAGDDDVDVSLQSLPRELVLRIAEQLVGAPVRGLHPSSLPRDVLHLAATCRRLIWLALDPVLWKRIYGLAFSPPEERPIDGPTNSIASSNAVAWAELYRTRVNLMATSINILVPFNLGDERTSFSNVSAALHAAFAAGDDGRSGRALASDRKLVASLLDAAAAVLEEVSFLRRLRHPPPLPRDYAWQLLQLLTGACIQDREVAKSAMQSRLWPVLRRFVGASVSPTALTPTEDDCLDAIFVSAAALYIVAHVSSLTVAACTLPIPRDPAPGPPAPPAAHDARPCRKHLPAAIHELSQPDRSWSGYYSYSLDPVWDGAAEAQGLGPWEQFDGPMLDIRSADDIPPAPGRLLRIDRHGRDAIDGFSMRGTINSDTGKAYLLKRYDTQGHGWSYIGFATRMGPRHAVAGFWFPVGFEGLLEDEEEWEGNCGPFLLWAE